MRLRTLTAVAAGLCLTAFAYSANAQTKGELSAPAGSTITFDGQTVSASGRALYTYDKDTGAQSNCVGECLAAWAALTPPASGGDSSGWTVITRSDGKKQLAYKGRPVYAFFRDKADGVATGANRIPGWNLAK